MEKSKLDYNTIIKGGLIVGGLFLGYKIVNTILQGFGLKKTDDEIEIDKNIKNNYAAALESFNPEYYLQAKAAGKIIQDLTPGSQEIIKNTIYNCIGYLYDNPQKCLAAFTTNIKYKTHVSIISHSFVNAYGESLLGYLTDRLDTAEQKSVLNEILKFVANLPSGISK